MNVREFIKGVATGLEEGGPGSGHWGHRGIPGRRGGSLPGAFSVKGTPSEMVAKHLEEIPGDPGDAEWHIFNLKVMLTYPWTPQDKAQAIRETISRYRYGQAITNKQIEVTPRIGRDVKLANSDADPKAAEYNHTLVNNDFDSYSHDYLGRVKLKNNICERLAERSGLPYEEVNDRNKEWAITANDTSAKAMAMQMAAQEEFGSKLSPWQQNQWKESGAESLISNDEMGKNRLFLRAMYEETQEHLRSLGVPADGFVTLYRGVKLPSRGRGDKRVAYEGNALESWTTQKAMAVVFADSSQVVTTRVPASRIISTATTGFGCLVENEVVVLGGLGPLEVIMR